MKAWWFLDVHVVSSSSLFSESSVLCVLRGVPVLAHSRTPQYDPPPSSFIGSSMVTVKRRVALVERGAADWQRFTVSQQGVLLGHVYRAVLSCYTVVLRVLQIE